MSGKIFLPHLDSVRPVTTIQELARKLKPGTGIDVLLAHRIEQLLLRDRHLALARDKLLAHRAIRIVWTPGSRTAPSENATRLVLDLCGEGRPVVEAVATDALPARAPMRLRPARARRVLGIALVDSGDARAAASGAGGVCRR